MKKPLIALGILFFILYGPLSCSHIETENKTRELIIDNLSLTTVKLHDGQFGLAIHDQELSSDDTLEMAAFGLMLEISEYNYVDVTPSTSSLYFPLISAALAISGDKIISQNISQISVTSSEAIYAVGKVYEPGSPLTHLFVAQMFSYQPQDIPQFLQNMGPWYADHQIFLRLSTSLDEPVLQPFQVQVILEDGREFNLEDQAIVVRN